MISVIILLVPGLLVSTFLVSRVIKPETIRSRGLKLDDVVTKVEKSKYNFDNFETNLL